MSAPTPFHLATAITAWRASLASSPALHGDSLDELESHLRSSIPSLIASGLSDEEAFLIASRRIGPIKAVQHEFAKVNESAVWASRASWMLAGVLLMQVLLPLSDLAMFLASVVAKHFIAIRSLRQIVPMAAIFGLEAVLVITAMRVLRSRCSDLTKLVWNLMARPVLAAIGLFILIAAAGELGRHFYRVERFEPASFPEYPSIPETYQYLRVFVLNLVTGVRPFHSGRFVAAAMCFIPQLALATAIAILGRRELAQSKAFN